MRGSQPDNQRRQRQGSFDRRNYSPNRHSTMDGMDSRDYDRGRGKPTPHMDYAHRYRGRRNRSRSRSRSRGRSRSRSRSPFRQNNRGQRGGQGRRHRSRSRSRSRNCDQHRHRCDSLAHQRYAGDLRDEPHEQDRNREREHRTVLNASSKTVHLRGLSQRTSESMIWALLERFAPQCVRLGPDREQDGAGNSLDGFASAFVDFQTADAAAACVTAFSSRTPRTPEGHSASLEIDSRNVSLCIATRPPARTRKQDWLCNRCKEINFARRSVCFSCKVPRDETCTLIGAGTDIIGPPAASNTPSTLVLVSGLASDTTEVAVGEALSAMAKVPIQEVRLARCRVSNAPRGWALATFLSTMDAEHALRQVAQQPGGTMTVDDLPVRLSFASPRPAVTNAAAVAALEQAQWASGAHVVGQQLCTTVPLPPPPVRQCEWPPAFEDDGASWVLEPRSGFYFHQPSAFYFDHKNCLYYNTRNATYYTYNKHSAATVATATAVTQGVDNVASGAGFTPYVHATSEDLSTPPVVEVPVATPDVHSLTRMDTGVAMRSSLSTCGSGSGGWSVPDVPCIEPAPPTISMSLKGARATKKKIGVAAVLAEASTSTGTEVTNVGSGVRNSNTISIARTGEIVVSQRKAERDMQTWEARRAEVARERDLQACDMMANLPDTASNFSHPNVPSAALAPDSSSPPVSSALQSTAPTFRQAAPVDLAALCQTYSAVSETVNSYPGSEFVILFKSKPLTAKQGDKWVCLLCRRQFDSEMQLRTHVVQSKMHAANATQAAADGHLHRRAPDTDLAAGYSDRAAARRHLHGQDDIPPVCARQQQHKRKHVSNSHRDSITDAYTPLVQTSALDTTNVGGQMLHKMGWEGGGLGKDGKGVAEPIRAQGHSRDGAGIGAGGSAHGRFGANAVPMGTPKHGSGYKEALKLKAAARFKEISHAQARDQHQ